MFLQELLTLDTEEKSKSDYIIQAVRSWKSKKGTG